MNIEKRLNPCFSGIVVVWDLSATVWYDNYVLILVLVE